MEIVVEYVPVQAAARVTFSSGVPFHVRQAVTGACRAADPQMRIAGDAILMAWGQGLSALLEIGALRREFGFEMRAEGAAVDRLTRFQKERRALSSAQVQAQGQSLSAEQLNERLLERGWDMGRRQLRDHQVEAVQLLSSLPNGANFSVPGAGKTTVTLAIHLTATSPDTHLFVVCPKNALQAWDDVIVDCMRDERPFNEPFVRLGGDDNELATTLNGGSTRFLINYDLLIRRQRVFMDYLEANRVHLVVDESHRIKDEDSSRARILTAAAHFPVRRDILSGTPVPHSPDDLCPQLDFLWPGSDLSRRIGLGEAPKNVISSLYVRVTKDRLGLPKVSRFFEPVVMGQAQFALYGAIRDRTIQQLMNLNPSDAVELSRAKRSVMRLLQASTNPVAAAQAMAANAEVLDRDRLITLLHAVVAEGDSPKMAEAIRRAELLADRGRKSVIWTNFRATIDRMKAQLAHLGAVEIHGDIKSGAPDDPETREGRIRRFHDDDDCQVLVANPAACSEGISLHKACHEAIYLDRTYNAGQYLQSIDRIHRLGLSPETVTNVTILQSVTPQGIASIDYAVARALLRKMRVMEEILEDEDIKQIALDEEENVENEVFDTDRELEDIRDLLETLQQARPATDFSEEEMA